MYAFERYKSQYKANLRLAMPVVLSQVGQVVVQLADNAMVGRLGALPLAAVSFGGSVHFILFIFGIGLTLGITPLVGNLFARGDRRISATYLQNAVLLYTLLGVVICMLLFAIVPLMPLLGQPAEVVEMAIPYFRLIAWGMIPIMLYGAFKQFLEGVGNTTVAMAVIITCNLLNIFLNWVFIYGNLGAQPMGATGAGLATLIARIAMPLLMIVYFVSKRSMRGYLLRFRWRRFSPGRAVQLLKVGTPIGSQMMLEGSAFVITSIMMGWIGTVEIAANQIALTVSNCAFMIILGISAATTIRISHTYGAGDWGSLRRVGYAAYHIGIAWNLFTALTFISLRNYLPLIFTSDPAVVEVASRLFVFVALFQISDGLQSITIGILRGLKDVSITMGIAFVSYILVNIPVGYACAFLLGWGAEGLWLGFIFGLTVAALLLFLRFRFFTRRLLRQLTPSPAPQRASRAK